MHILMHNKWWALSDLNGRPFGCKPNALTAELSALTLVIVQEAAKSVNGVREIAFSVPGPCIMDASVNSSSGFFAANWPVKELRPSLVFRDGAKIWLEIASGDDAIIAVIIRCELGRSFRVGAVRLLQSVCILG
jgi:hypothetical protein